MRGPQARRVGSGTVHGTVPQGGQSCIPHHQVQRHHKDGHACDARAQGQLIGEKHIHHHSQRHPKNIGHGLAPRLVAVVDQLHGLNPTNQQTFGAPSQQQRHGHKEKHAAPVRSQVFAGCFDDAQGQGCSQGPCDLTHPTHRHHHQHQHQLFDRVIRLQGHQLRAQNSAQTRQGRPDGKGQHLDTLDRNAQG